ncbi:hypothetical protein A2U01_0089996, partial [Trifolium medium]|nr:hypothetical protein [Trifolium medium]
METQWQGHHRNDTKVHVLEEIMATGLANLPPTREKGIMMGPDGNA